MNSVYFETLVNKSTDMQQLGPSPWLLYNVSVWDCFHAEISLIYLPKLKDIFINRLYNKLIIEQ